MTCALKRKYTEAYTQRRPCGGRGRDEIDSFTNQGLPRPAGQPEAGEHGQVLPQGLQKDPTLMTPWFQVWYFLNREKINFYLFKAPSGAIFHRSSGKLLQGLRRT